jgi:hypothetical protein
VDLSVIVADYLFAAVVAVTAAVADVN